jgi:putative transposase
VSITKVCHGFGVARSSVYYKPSRTPPKIDPAIDKPIKALIEAEPSFGY